jgi:hypothetical protein
MTTEIETGRTVAWRFWLVVAIAMLWNGFGAYDYLMSQTSGDAYMRSMGMTDTHIAYMHAMPAWMTAVWALGVWGSAVGSILLLLRSKWAFHAFVASFAGLVVSLVYTYLLSGGGEVVGSQGTIMNVVITAGCIFFIWYARVMTARRVLR